MGQMIQDSGWRIPDALWEQMVGLLPLRPHHPLGCHNPRVDDRKAMDAIFFVLRTGCQWGALDATGICNHSSAHRRFQEWTAAGVFVTLWATGLDEYGELQGLKREAGFKARRWVVERTHSWMNRFRRILIRWEKKVENYSGMLHLVCAWITYRCCGLLR